MDIEKLKQEAHVEAAFTFHQLFHKAELPIEPVLVHGGGAIAVAAFHNLADRLKYGSVVVMGDLNEKYLNAINEHGALHDWRSWPLAGVPEGYAAWVRSVHDNAVYPTYWDQLVEAVKQTTGPVLCLGAHEKVAAELHELCAKKDRLLITVDADPVIFDQLGALISPHHFIDVEGDPSQSKWLERDDWGVIFIDHTNGATRKVSIERARERAELVVVHDTDNFEYGLSEEIGKFANKTTFSNSRPWTTVASTKRQIWDEGTPAQDKHVAAKRVKVSDVITSAAPVEDFPTEMETPAEAPVSKKSRKEREGRA